MWVVGTLSLSLVIYKLRCFGLWFTQFTRYLNKRCAEMQTTPIIYGPWEPCLIIVAISGSQPNRFALFLSDKWCTIEFNATFGHDKRSGFLVRLPGHSPCPTQRLPSCGGVKIKVGKGSNTWNRGHAMSCSTLDWVDRLWRWEWTMVENGWKYEEGRAMIVNGPVFDDGPRQCSIRNTKKKPCRWAEHTRTSSQDSPTWVLSSILGFIPWRSIGISPANGEDRTCCICNWTCGSLWE